MKPVALIFPGQGAQKVGMGLELYEASNEARAVINRADEILGNGLKGVMFNGPEDKLMLTAYTQPAIYTMSMAALSALKAHDKFKNIEPKFACGLSLGEYSALCASGALSFESTLNLLGKRAVHMKDATKITPGSMAAIIGLSKEKVIEVCAKTGSEVANFNSPEQIVITGHADKVEAACTIFDEAGAKGVVRLNVSGAFHSSLMRSAEENFTFDLADTVFGVANMPLVGNVDATPAIDPYIIRNNLAKQITSSVQWVDTVVNISQEGVTDFIEIGPGKVLKGLIRRIDRNLKVYNIETPADIEALPY